MKSQGTYRNDALASSTKIKKEEVVKKIKKKVTEWLWPLCSGDLITNSVLGPSTWFDGNKEEIENELIFKLFTHYNEYTFLITIDYKNENHFMEASVKPRMTAAGKVSSVPRVLPNGDLSEDLWNQLKNCFIKNELVDNVAPDWKRI